MYQRGALSGYGHTTAQVELGKWTGVRPCEEVAAAAQLERTLRRDVHVGRGLTLVHFPAQPEHFLRSFHDTARGLISLTSAQFELRKVTSVRPYTWGRRTCLPWTGTTTLAPGGGCWWTPLGARSRSCWTALLRWGGAG